MRIKVETWSGNAIRFIEMAPGDWWAVVTDVARAMNHSNPAKMIKALKPHQKGVTKGYTPGGAQELSIISEQGLYKVIMRSNKPEAQAFEDWVCDVILTLRRASGLEGFQVFRMLDKDHQKETMLKLRNGLSRPVRVDFIKANTIANKAVSANHGYPLMIKKDQMTPDMLLERQPILEDTVRLMAANDSFGLGLSVSDAVYGKYCL